MGFETETESLKPRQFLTYSVQSFNTYIHTHSEKDGEMDSLKCLQNFVV